MVLAQLQAQPPDSRRCRPLPSQQHPSLRLPARLSSSDCTVARVHMDPKVTFVLPCYKLAHLLSECVSSILDQTYTDFELLIMDDCSPDNTSEIAASFTDPRVKYIRNPRNLGHLQNYNKGIAVARGKYVWLISADDTLRRRYALERYVQLLDKHPNVGYVFSPAVRL